MKRPELPNWPRLLDHAQAAAYVSASINTFDAEVKAGVWPKGRRRMQLRGRTDSGERGTLVWDRAALDAAADRMNSAPTVLSDEAARAQAQELRDAARKIDWLEHSPRQKKA